jgi:hypothetical protein
MNPTQQELAKIQNSAIKSVNLTAEIKPAIVDLIFRDFIIDIKKLPSNKKSII